MMAKVFSTADYALTLQMSEIDSIRQTIIIDTSKDVFHANHCLLYATIFKIYNLE